MPQYFPEELGSDLNNSREKVISDKKFYGPALEFLYDRDEDFQTEDLVASVNAVNSDSRLDSHRAGSLLGALRDEYGLIEGFFCEEGSYHWDPELRAEGDWEDVKKELDAVNNTEKAKE